MFKITGLDELQDNLEKLAKRAEQLHGSHTVKLEDLFTADFMRRFTDFLTLDEMFTAGGFVIESQEDFEALNEDALNALVAKRTLFASWQDMKKKAVAEWAASRLGLE